MPSLDVPSPLATTGPDAPSSRLADFLNAARDGMALCRRLRRPKGEDDFTLVQCNARLAAQLGPAAQPGVSVASLGGLGGVTLAALQRADTPGAAPTDLDIEVFDEQAGRWFDVTLVSPQAEEVVLTFHDITAFKIARAMPGDLASTLPLEASVARSEARLREARQCAQLGCWDTDLLTGELQWSPEMFEVYGRPLGASLTAPQDCLASVLPEDRARTDEAFASAMTNQTPMDITHRVALADGRIRHVRVRGRFTYSTMGRPLRALGTAQDVTEELASQAALQHSEMRLRAVFTAMSEGLVIQDHEGHILQANAAAAPILGLSHDELIGRTSLDPRWQATHPDGSPWPGQDHPGMVALRTGQEQRNQLLGVIAPGQGQRWLRINATPLWLDGPERPSGCVASFVDVTDQVVMQRQLQTTIHELADLYDNAPCGYHMLDAEGHFIRVNQTELDWLGCTREELIGRLKPTDFFTAEGKRTFAVNFPKLKASGRLEGLELDLLGRQGVRRRVLLQATVILDANGQFMATRSVLHDITEMVEAEAARLFAIATEAQQAQTLEVQRQKDEFLASMSHELRTPLNAVIGFAQLLQSSLITPSTPRYQQYLEHIANSGDHLLRPIDVMLELARAQTGHMVFLPEAINLRTQLMDVVHTLRPQAAARQIEVQIDILGELDGIRLDPVRLRLVLLCLLDNAIKFSNGHGQVLIRAMPLGEQAFRIEVHDHGIGIAAHQLDRLFTRFDQLSQGASRSHGGAGLGLALVKLLVEAQGGEVGVQSAPEVGSVFHITLPRLPFGASGA